MKAPMQAVILAGGLGTRLGDLTRDVPKPMIPVAGKPYLEHQLLLLGRQKITGIVLLTGYLGERVEEYFGNGSRLGLNIRYSREPRPIGTGGALRDARALIDDPFLLIYGDSFLPIEYAGVIERLLSSGATGALVVYDDARRETNVRPNVALDDNGLVIRYDKSEAVDPELRYVEAGVLAFRREVLDLIPLSGAVSLETEVFPRLIARRSLTGIPTKQRFYDIGTPERLRVIEEFLR